MNSVPAHHMLTTLVDTKNRLGNGKESDGPIWYFCTRSNRNGEPLRDTAQKCNMEFISICFRKKANRISTHLSIYTLNKVHIDYIFIRWKRRHFLTNMEAYKTFQILGSDNYRVVVSCVKVSFRKNRRPPKRFQYHYNALTVDADL